MTIEDLVHLIEGVRRTPRASKGLCPAHPDRSPSLSIREAEDGRILLHCFAGCSITDVCQSIGLRVADLFPDQKREGGKREPLSLIRRPRDWRAMAWRFQFHALLLWLRADDVLKGAKGLDTSSWSDEENNAAMRAVINARGDIERADILEGVAFGIRARG